MASIDPKILSKIKKCLALAGSCNPNEAATAMRQARALMDKHGISEREITLSDIGESNTPSKTMARDKPAAWEMRLAGMIGKAFGCKLMVKRTSQEYGYANKAEYIFVGLHTQTEIAAYTASVLIRKCKAARQKWIAEKISSAAKRKVGKAEVTHLGDVFASGWVESIARLVSDFANPPEVDAVIKQHVEQVTQNRVAASRGEKLGDKELSQAEIVAASMGMQAAKDERLFRPMNTQGGAQQMKLAAAIQAE